METIVLLQRCERLTHSQRVAQMVDLGRKSKKELSSKELIASLSDGSLYSQSLALETCHGSHDISLAIKALSSPSKHLKKRAINLIALLGTDKELLDALISVPTYLQISTIRRLRDSRRRRRREEVIDDFLKDLEKDKNGKAVFKPLLFLGPKALVERHLRGLVEGFSILEWGQLAKYHRDLTQKELHDWILRSEDDDPRLLSVIESVFTKWIAHEYSVDSAFQLFRNALELFRLRQLPVQELALCRPKEAVEIFLSSEDDISDQIAANFGYEVLRKLPLDQFNALFKRYPGIAAEWFFGILKPEQRLVVYKERGEWWRDNDGVLNVNIVEAIPTEERVKEARRHLKLKKLEPTPFDRIEYIALLPWDEAMELQLPFLKSGDVDTRSKALEEQIKSARYDDSHLGDALKLVLFRKNEQDPVHRVMLTSLATKIPCGRWKEQHLPDLTQIVRNTLDVGGLNVHTVSRLVNLVTNLLSTYPEWAATQFTLIASERSFHSRIKLSGVTPVKEVMNTVEEKMSPILQKLVRKKDGETLAVIGQAFDIYVKYWPELLDTCEQVCDIREMINTHHFMINILKRGRPKEWGRVIPALIKEDLRTPQHAMVANTTIVEYIHRRQQPFLNEYLITGEEIPQYKREALNQLYNGFWRLTEVQQTALASILLKDINDDDVSIEKKVEYIKQLGLLLFLDPKPLTQLASDERPPIFEAALAALSHLDGDQGLPVLIDALSDHRARKAIYALRSALSTMTKPETFDLLRSVSQEKVTVAKETFRLIGELETEEAYYFLLEREKEDLHPSVRIALFRALWSYLDYPQTWEIFTKAAKDAKPETAKAVVKIPDDGMFPEMRIRLLKLLLQVMDHPVTEVRLAALNRLRGMPLQDPDNLLMSRLFELVHSEYEDESDAAARAIFKTYAKNQVELIGEMFRKLLRGDRKTLRSVYTSLLWLTSPDYLDDMRPVVHEVLKVLKTDRLSVTRRVDLLFGSLPWNEIKTPFLEMIPELHADALARAEMHLESNQNGWMRFGDERVLLVTEKELRESADEKTRRLGLSCLIGSGSLGEARGKWTKVQREILEIYKRDESPLVAEKAWDVEVPVEEEEEEEKGGKNE